MAEKTLRLQTKNRDLARLVPEIETNLRPRGYETQSAAMVSGRVIQSQRCRIPSDTITAERTLTICVTRHPGDFAIRASVRDPDQNLVVMAMDDS